MLKRTDLTRRAAVAGAPAAAAAALAAGTAVNAVAVAMAKAAGADPTFEMIELHRRALRVHVDAYALFMKLDVDYEEPERGIVLGEKPESKLDRVSAVNQVDEFHVRWVKTGRMIPVTAYFPEDIRKEASRFAPDGEGEKEAWIAQKTAELERHQDAIDRAEAATQRGKALAHADHAEEVLIDLTESLTSLRPTTIQGLAAALAYWSEFGSKGADSFGHLIDAMDVMGNLAEAAKALA
jgi:hypothetical protein